MLKEWKNSSVDHTIKEKILYPHYSFSFWLCLAIGASAQPLCAFHCLALR
jgi:Na+/pantothenate symporter